MKINYTLSCKDNLCKKKKSGNVVFQQKALDGSCCTVKLAFVQRDCEILLLKNYAVICKSVCFHFSYFFFPWVRRNPCISKLLTLAI